MDWGIAPSEFWRMHMAELFYILESQNAVHNPPQKAGLHADEFDRLKTLLDEERD